MKKVPAAILLGYLAISLACVTFAWMNEPDAPEGNVAVLEYDADDTSKSTLRIQSRSISCTAYAYDSDANDYVNLESLDSLFATTGFVPGRYIDLKFSFTNSSDAVSDVTLTAYDITTSNPAIFDYIIFGVSREDSPVDYISFNSSVGTYTPFSNAEPSTPASGDTQTKYSLELISNLEIVPTQEGTTMDIYCYFMLAKSADSRFEDLTLSLGHFRVIM